MSLQTIAVSSRELDRHIGKVKKYDRNGPVFITERGRPAYVLLTIEDYQALTGTEAVGAEQTAPADEQKHR